MATTLAEGASSDYIASLSYFRPAHALPQILVYVEDEQDIVFWEKVFSPYQGQYNIQIDILENNGAMLKGKHSLLSTIPLSSLGPHKWIAIDSDYDLIIDDYSIYTNSIRSNPYILNTCTYSIENLKCHPDNLDDFIIKISMTSRHMRGSSKRRIENLFQLTSDLFLIHLASIQNKDSQYDMNGWYRDLDNIRQCKIKDNAKAQQQIEASLQRLNDYKNANQPLISEIEERLQALGFERKDYYLLMNGHHLVKIIVNLTALIIRNYRNEHFKKLKMDSNPTRKSNNINHYRSFIGQVSIREKLESMIMDCNNIEKEPYISKIREKLNAAFS